jgi:hypothetical protein
LEGEWIRLGMYKGYEGTFGEDLSNLNVTLKISAAFLAHREPVAFSQLLLLFASHGKGRCGKII